MSAKPPTRTSAPSTSAEKATEQPQEPASAPPIDDVEKRIDEIGMAHGPGAAHAASVEYRSAKK